ncbi:MAG: Lrp/AsnC ligand binding domain-containing protein [Candidatus Ranarchaeia archaeon]
MMDNNENTKNGLDRPIGPDAGPTEKRYRAYLLAKVKPGEDYTVLKNVRKLPHVINADIVYGAADLIIHVAFENFKELQQIVYDLVHSLEGIEDTDTCFVSSLNPT